VDIGCYQPAVGYYGALGWQEVVGVAKEEGECSGREKYRTSDGVAFTSLILDVEREEVPEPDGSADVVLMMEVLEHFGLDPMHAVAEANRLLKPGGLLVMSTPNAAAFSALYRICIGKAPHAGLEFSGFSTNRHNRLYDAAEVVEILRKGGFEPEMWTSRSYRTNRRSLPKAAFMAFWRQSDRLVQSVRRVKIERGEYLFCRARKCGHVIERYPRVLYFAEREFPDWQRAIRRGVKTD
jgi:SAM-dependent methyltransferase